MEVLAEAIRRLGKPEAVYTDRGGAFLAWGETSSFGAFLERELIDHHVGHSYHPQGRGKVEAVIHSVRRELWETRHFDSVEAAEQSLARFFHDYNHRRAHMGTDGLTPADRFFGRWEEVRQEVEAGAKAWYGLGWLVRPVGEGFTCWHGGSLPGTAAIVVRTADGFTWSALFNFRAADIDGFHADLDATLLGRIPSRAVPHPAPASSHPT